MDINNLKLCVYAICKNEEKFVERWVEGIKEADYIVVLDTGSTDNTVELLMKYSKIKVVSFNYNSHNKVFRFDTARNDSMKLIPFDTDICVVLDLDHIPRPGWSNIIKKEFLKGNKEVHGYIVDHSKNSTLNRWISKNVHPNDPNYVWERMIHEGIHYKGSEEIKSVFREDFIIDHYPDDSKDRTNYRSLLENAIKLYPKDPYYRIYYGIELSVRYSKKEAYNAFKIGLEECDFTDNKDLHYLMLLDIAGLCDNNIKALEYLDEALELGIETRRIYKIYADVFEKLGDSNGAIEALERSLEINAYKGDWTDDFILYDGYIEDRLSLFYYYQRHDPVMAMSYELRALKYHPDDERLNKNFNYYYNEYLNLRGNINNGK